MIPRNTTTTALNQMTEAARQPLARKHLAFLAAALFAIPFANAGDFTTDAKVPLPEGILEQKNPWNWQITTEYTYVAPSSFTGTVDAGDISAMSIEVNALSTFDLSPALTLRGIAGWETFWFGGNDSVGAIPNRFTNLTLGLGAEYRFLQRFFVRADFLPELSIDGGNTSWEHVSFTLISVVGYSFSQNLTIFAGALVQPHLEFPVIPIGGLIWKISEEWQLNATVPRASLVYAPGRNWEFFASGRLITSQFRTDGDFVVAVNNRTRDLGDDWLSYIDIQVGGGIAYKIAEAARISVETGASLFRRFDYQDADFQIDGDPSPYVSAQFRFSF